MHTAVTRIIDDSRKARLEALLALAQTTFTAAEHVSRLNLDVARSLIDDVSNHAQAQIELQDTPALFAFQLNLAAPLIEKGLAYSRAAFEIARNTQNELLRSFDDHQSDARRSLNELLDKSVRTSPMGGDIFALAMKAALTSANHAYEHLNQAARQLNDLAEAKVEAATDIAEISVRAAKAAASPVAKPAAKARKTA